MIGELLPVLVAAVLAVWALIMLRRARRPRRDFLADRRVDRYHRSRDRSFEEPRASRTSDGRYVR